ncbi:hypothetical protein ElyMa_000920200 [Elysia marginata]|uniref:BAG domain-containing protein n=1 Tax=Elysia marginata TaxID=1093978 RepID=A0AAV4HAJ6_9GAST|nr:hypothetical protein ElyMa_000920200 [Elysia marginata]
MEKLTTTKRPKNTLTDNSDQRHDSVTRKKAKNPTTEARSGLCLDTEFYSQDYTSQEMEQFMYRNDSSGDKNASGVLHPHTEGQEQTEADSASTEDDTTADTAAAPEVDGQEKNEYTSFSELLRELGQESKMVVLQYSQTFGDSEAYEQQACQNCVDLKAHASLLEQYVNQRKKVLHARLKEILKALSIDGNDDF